VGFDISRWFVRNPHTIASLFLFARRATPRCAVKNPKKEINTGRIHSMKDKITRGKAYQSVAIKEGCGEIICGTRRP
jgi:hypothetical protein